MDRTALICTFLLTMDSHALAYYSPAGWIPLPDGGSSQTSTTLEPDTGGIFQNSVRDLINAFRQSYQVSPLTWNSTLESQAKQCANNHVASATPFPPTSCKCGSPDTAETLGLNTAAAPSRGARAIISDPHFDSLSDEEFTQAFKWFAAFSYNNQNAAEPCFYWQDPKYNPRCEYFTQMIWASTLQVGCSYSDRGSDFGIIGAPPSRSYYALSCCWWPAGNSPAIFKDNIFEDNM